ncbi:hypothetical protein [Geothrix sp. 21YS21S-2]|uniref:hypothetical protein n=1 Tax=Geothrix sp. 21YS21S-2 TaxID=3068893 RepID=UPI0027B9B2D0|nr:hypothetical protein [Geothrix sp. 21YS21S-2]
MDRALGDLVRILSTIDLPRDHIHMIAAFDFLEWFHDRFHLPPGACSAKAFGDGLAFAIRLGLVRIKKVARTREKITTYTGIDVTTLDAAHNRWKGSCGPSHAMDEVAVLPSLVSDLPDVPWDVEGGTDTAPVDYLAAVMERMELNKLESCVGGVDEDDSF